MWKTDYLKVLICVALLVLSGCDSSQNDRVKKINTIKIVEIQPPLSEPLKHGQKIITEVRLAYDLQSKSAVVTLAVLRSKGFGHKSLASTFAIIQHGKGELVLKVEYIVPINMEVINVHALLTPQQRNDSAPVAKRTYRVAR